MAATATQRGKPQSHLLHCDFSSPVLKPWGSQRLLLRDGVDGDGEGVAGKPRSAPSAPLRDYRFPVSRIGSPEDTVGDDDGGLEELRKKLLGHLREAANKMKLGVPHIDLPASTSAAAEVPSSDVVEAEIPWTLRTRRAAKRAAQVSPAAKATAEKTVRLRSENTAKKEKRKFSVSLSREEIEEDIFSLTGSRPRRRPKKRAKIVQRQLDAIFPGLWLSEITPESYSVPE